MVQIMSYNVSTITDAESAQCKTISSDEKVKGFSSGSLMKSNVRCEYEISIVLSF